MLLCEFLYLTTSPSCSIIGTSWLRVQQRESLFHKNGFSINLRNSYCTALTNGTDYTWEAIIVLIALLMLFKSMNFFPFFLFFICISDSEFCRVSLIVCFGFLPTMQIYSKRFKAHWWNGRLYYLTWYLWSSLVYMIKHWNLHCYPQLDHLWLLFLFMICLYQEIPTGPSTRFLVEDQLQHCHWTVLLHMVLS